MNVQAEKHSMSYELGFNQGDADARDGSIPLPDEIEAMGIATWQQARKSMELDLIQFVAGYVEARNMYLNGFI
jgi:hypothetical protein